MQKILKNYLKVLFLKSFFFVFAQALLFGSVLRKNRQLENFNTKLRQKKLGIINLEWIFFVIIVELQPTDSL